VVQQQQQQDTQQTKGQLPSGAVSPDQQWLVKKAAMGPATGH